MKERRRWKHPVVANRTFRGEEAPWSCLPMSARQPLSSRPSLALLSHSTDRPHPHRTSEGSPEPARRLSRQQPPRPLRRRRTRPVLLWPSSVSARGTQSWCKAPIRPSRREIRSMSSPRTHLLRRRLHQPPHSHGSRLDLPVRRAASGPRGFRDLQLLQVQLFTGRPSSSPHNQPVRRPRLQGPAHPHRAREIPWRCSSKMAPTQRDGRSFCARYLRELSTVTEPGRVG